MKTIHYKAGLINLTENYVYANGQTIPYQGMRHAQQWIDKQSKLEN